MRRIKKLGSGKRPVRLWKHFVPSIHSSEPYRKSWICCNSNISRDLMAKNNFLDYHDFFFSRLWTKKSRWSCLCLRVYKQISGGQRIEEEFIFAVNSHGNLSGSDPTQTTIWNGHPNSLTPINIWPRLRRGSDMRGAQIGKKIIV